MGGQTDIAFQAVGRAGKAVGEAGLKGGDGGGGDLDAHRRGEVVGGPACDVVSEIQVEACTALFALGVVRRA